MTFPKEFSASDSPSRGGGSTSGPSMGASPSPGSSGINMPSLSKMQKNMAYLIIRTGLQMGFGWRDIKTALMTAYQESRLQNLNYGSGSSLGLFQQTDVWEGTDADHMNPEWATRSFYRALRDVNGRSQMPLWQVAQAVQRSAYPTAYRQWHDEAARIIKWYRGGHPGGHFNQPNPAFSTDPGVRTDKQGFVQFKNPMDKKKHGPLDAAVNPALNASDEPLVLPSFSQRQDYNRAMEQLGLAPGRGTGNMTANGIRKRLIQIAKGQIGVPYVWGGESPSGFDCSGFTQWAYQQIGINIPRVSYQQGQQGYAAFGRRVNNLSKLQPGDMVFWDNSSRNNGADHVAIYLGHGKIIEAPRPGRSVGISSLYDTGNAWGVHLNL